MNLSRFVILAASLSAVSCGVGCRRGDAPRAPAANKSPATATATNAGPAKAMAVEDTPHADDEIVLTVNTNRLTWKELKFGVDVHFTRMRGSLGLLGQQQQRAYRNDLFKKLCRSYVYQYLILDEVRRLGLTLSAEEQAKVAKAAKEMSTAIGLKPQDLRQALPAPGFLEQQAEQVLLVAKYEKQEISDKLKVSDSDVARRIAELQKEAADRERISSEKKQRIEDLHRQLKAGADFAALAKAHSECPSAPKGGVLGVYTREEIQDLSLRTAAFALQTGEISEVLKTDDGYLILKALAAKPATRDAEGKLLTPATVELAQLLLMTEAPEPVPTPEELADNLRKNGLRQGKLDLLKRLKDAAKIKCALFPDLVF
jgi:parvulin-like peptidyl-prolyl isomerase